MIDSFITFYFIVLLLLLLYLKRGKKDFFHVIPFTILFSMAEVPYLYFIAHNPQELHPKVIYYLDDFNFAFFQHVMYKLIFAIVCIFTMAFFEPKGKLFGVSNIGVGMKVIKFKYASYFFIVLTILMFALFLHKVGGFFFLISNMDNKTLVVQGTAVYRNIFFISAMLSIGYYITYLSLKRIKLKNYVFLFFISVFFFAMLASYGERKNPLLLLVFLVLMWNYKIKNVNVFSVKNLLLLFFLVFFASLAPILRVDGALDYYMSDPSSLIPDALPYMGELFKRFSDIDISLFIFPYFDSINKLWFGSTFMDFFTGFIPSSFYEAKPPLDEGVYIYNFAQGNNVAINSPFKYMIPVGWPLSRVTAGYVHFGPVGVILYAILTGMILKYFYQVMISSKFAPLWVSFYAFMMLTGFGISNAFIFNTLTIFVLLMLFTLFIYLFEGKKNVSR
tara:strand:+ start:8648 stop:9988 length:1341 start_codon:yes stop_codon:yes gene_type:complete